MASWRGFEGSIGVNQIRMTGRRTFKTEEASVGIHKTLSRSVKMEV